MKTKHPTAVIAILFLGSHGQPAVSADEERFVFETHFDGMAPELDLGDAFRRNPVSKVPVLVLSGTLDGRTFIESQREAVADLRNASLITVNNAGHNLFDEPSDELQQTIDRFMEGKLVPSLDATITVNLPDMAADQAQ